MSEEPATAPGLTWRLFKGDWPWMPDFRTLEPVNQGQHKGIRLPMVRGSEAGGVAFEGFFDAPESGEYNFTLESDTGAMLFLHDMPDASFIGSLIARMKFNGSIGSRQVGVRCGRIICMKAVESRN